MYYLTGKMKFDEFTQLVPTIDVNMVPIKILKNVKSKENKYGGKLCSDHHLFRIEKIKNKWYINEKAIELFLKIGLDEFYYLPFT